ncbi:response regulator [Methylobacterium sp. SD21]|uniref:response regulator n=1 Tax=Methylobacterium litchii TaxID=3138810 RepID=UPI00313E3D56
MNILIADADEETRLTLLEAIVAVLPDACVREATNGLELRRAIAETSPDILFIETILPGTNAEMITTWRAGAGAHSVIVLVADLLAARWPTIARRLNAYDVLLKPLGQRNVRHVLQAAAFLCRELTLLFVEPGAKTRQVAQQIFAATSFRFRVIEAQDGRSAVKVAATQAIDLVVIGPSIPDMPPSEVACRIDAHGTGARIVMVVGSNEDMSASKLSLFGASTTLRLPFTATDIDRAVYETYGLWQPYLLEALRKEYERHEDDLAAASAAR